MIKVLKYSEINFEKYKKSLERACQNSDFAEKTFLDIVTDKRYFLLILNDYEAVMPVSYVKKFGILFVIMPKLCQQLGIFSKEDNSDTNKLFYDFLNKNFLVASYSFNGSNKFGICIPEKTSYVLNKNSYETVKKNYSSHRRRNVRITPDLENELSFRDVLKNDVQVFFKKNLKGTKSVEESHAFYEVLKKLLNQNIGNVRILEFKNQIRSFIYLYEGRRAHYLSLFVNNYPLPNPNFPSIMIDRCLKEFIDIKNFDFVGSDLEPVAQFNQRFGADIYHYSIISNSSLTLFKKLLTSYRIISNFALYKF